MSNYLQMLRKSEDGSTFQLFYPVDPKKAKFPLFDAAADTGRLKEDPTLSLSSCEALK